jgi:DNA-directed RNA polymerase II subunit RPB1
MGMQGMKRLRGRDVPFALFVLLALPALGGCSSSSSWMPSSWSSNPPPNQTATAVPPPNAPAQRAQAGVTTPSSYAASKPVADDDPRNNIYPTVSLLDLFKEGTPTSPSYTPSAPSYYPSTASSAAPNMPHPPATYTPSGQPYSPPPGQPAAAAPAAPAPPPSDADLAASVYPKQSLIDIFKQQAQDGH